MLLHAVHLKTAAGRSGRVKQVIWKVTMKKMMWKVAEHQLEERFLNQVFRAFLLNVALEAVFKQEDPEPFHFLLQGAYNGMLLR